MADTETKITKSIKTTTYPHPRKIRRVLRVIGWNLLLTLAGLALIALTGEVYLRLKRSMIPFSTVRYHWHFVPKVGLMLKPNDEARWTNHRDFWTISRTNSLGFVDREPISSERAAASCHITMIGDSFVDARRGTYQHGGKSLGIAQADLLRDRSFKHMQRAINRVLFRINRISKADRPMTAWDRINEWLGQCLTARTTYKQLVKGEA